jgi:uncharacterized protein
MERCSLKKNQPGRHFVGPLPDQKDLIGAIEAACKHNVIDTATFSITGSVSSATIGVFDPVQQVYVTHLEKDASELLLCQGTFSMVRGKPCVKAKVILADQQGQLTGGHLFSETIIHDATIDLQEQNEIP